MKMLQLFTVIILLCQQQVTLATSAKISVYDEITDLNVVKTALLNDDRDKGSTLVIFDIDDTLLEAVNFVGSDKWYTWQRGREVYSHDGELIKVKKEQVYACMFSILGTLYDLGTSKLTQPDAAKIITDLKHYNMMLLTSRTYSFRRATERELGINGFNFTNNHLIDANKTLDFSLYDGNRTDRVTYNRGLVMSSGLNKGKVLREVLTRIGKDYKSIYFVDDGRKNITNMRKEWNSDHTDFNIYHYTRVDKKISAEEIAASDKAKIMFDGFMESAYSDRSTSFDNGTCR